MGRREIQDRLAELSWWRRNRSLYTFSHHLDRRGGRAWAQYGGCKQVVNRRIGTSRAAERTTL